MSNLLSSKTSHQRSNFPRFALLLICLLVLSIAAIIFLTLRIIPEQAETTFGPAVGGLGWAQKLRLSFELDFNSNLLTQPASLSGEKQSFQVQLGEGVELVAKRLANAGLLRDADLFRAFLIYSGMDTHLQAGLYQLSPSMNGLEIAKTLEDASPDEISFGVLPGWRLEEIAASLPTSGLSITSDQFISAASSVIHVPSLITELPPNATLEGFLFPGTYTFRRDMAVNEMLIRMVNEFDNQVTPVMREGYQRQNLNLYQAVTLASIVQKEAMVADEQPQIASVFFNRLAAGMSLDSDPTVQYGLGFNDPQNTWWTNPLTSQDMQVDSLYNTYTHRGLPPGPISNPSLSALQAVSAPAQTPYLYFRAKCDGSHRHAFAITFEEHLKNACP